MPTASLAERIRQELPQLAQRLLADETLCLSSIGRLRGKEQVAHVYYRGSKLLSLFARESGLRWEPIDTAHFAGGSSKPPDAQGDLDTYLRALPVIKDAMDCNGKLHWEREVQQTILRVNSRCPQHRHGTSNVDVIFTDMEYVQPRRAGTDRRADYRFDLVGVFWPSTGSDRKAATGLRQVLAELKCGHAAVDGGAGLSKHLRSFLDFLADDAARQELAADTVRSFQALHQLGLVSSKHAIRSIDHRRKPLCLLLLADIDPATSRLRKVLASCQAIIAELSSLCDLHYVRSQQMGYGIYQTMPVSDLITASEESRPSR